MVVDIRFIGFFHFLRGTHDFHTEGCVVEKTQINKNHNPQTQRHAQNYQAKILEPKPKTQPNFFQQLHRDKIQRHSTITQRQNSNLDFSVLNTKLKTQNSNSKSMNKT